MNNGRSWLSCATLRLQNPLYESNSDAQIEYNSNNNNEENDDEDDDDDDDT